MKNILAGFGNSGIWPFARNAFSDEDFKVASIVCGGRMNTVVTAWSVGLTTPAVAQVGSSVEKKVTPEEVCPYPRTAPSVSTSGRQKGK